MKKKELTGSHLDNVRFRILSSAKELFIQYGYKKTTIRQIVEKSGVLTGSIYYFFKNKEDIFQALILSLLRQCVNLINEHFADSTPAFKYAAMCIVELKAGEINELTRESYYEGYTSKVIFEKMIDHVSAISQHLFSRRELSFSENDFYLRTLLIKGAMRSYVAQFYFSKQVPSEAYRKLFVQTALSLFYFSDAEIEDVIRQLDQDDEVLTQIALHLINQSIQI
jgi:AcrR family transcriptional regulator